MVHRLPEPARGCPLHKDDPRRQSQEFQLATPPGSVVIFNGDKLWHAVTPLGEGEERVVLSMEYVTNPAMGPFKRFISTMKDGIASFGFAAVPRNGRRRRRAASAGTPSSLRRKDPRS